MKIPAYIEKHIIANNQLLAQADKHAMIVRKWYEKQLDKLNAENSVLSAAEFSEIQTNWRANGDIDLSVIRENLELLEQKDSEVEAYEKTTT